MRRARSRLLGCLLVSYAASTRLSIRATGLPSHPEIRFDPHMQTDALECNWSRTCVFCAMPQKKATIPSRPRRAVRSRGATSRAAGRCPRRSWTGRWPLICRGRGSRRPEGVFNIILCSPFLLVPYRPLAAGGAESIAAKRVYTSTRDLRSAETIARLLSDAAASLDAHR